MPRARDHLRQQGVDLQRQLQEAQEERDDAEQRLAMVKIRCQEYIAGCCGDDEERFCDNYGCSTLRDFLDIVGKK